MRSNLLGRVDSKEHRVWRLGCLLKGLGTKRKQKRTTPGSTKQHFLSLGRLSGGQFWKLFPVLISASVNRFRSWFDFLPGRLQKSGVYGVVMSLLVSALCAKIVHIDLMRTAGGLLKIHTKTSVHLWRGLLCATTKENLCREKQGRLGFEGRSSCFVLSSVSVPPEAPVTGENTRKSTRSFFKSFCKSRCVYNQCKE